MMYLIKKIVVITALVFGLVFLPTHTFAQITPIQEASPSASIETIEVPADSGINLTLSPVFLNLTAYAGKSVKSTIKLTNNNEFTEKYRLSVIKFVPDTKGESIIPIEDASGDETLDWVKLARPEVTVRGGSAETVEFEVTVPEYAFLGYYFGISAQRAAEPGEQGTAKVVGQAIMPILLDVVREGDKGPLFVDGDEGIYKRAELASFTTSSWWYEYLPTDFEIRFKNTGKVHLVPFGDMLIQQGGIDVGSLPINEGRGNTMPGVTRTYTASWADGFIVREPVQNESGFVLDEQGNKTYNTVVRWDALPKMRIGKYTAKAIVVYNNGRHDVPLEALVSFWVIPWKIILALTLILTLVIFGIKSAVSNLMR